jgi:methanogenic corrinoid protein MtbC1
VSGPLDEVRERFLRAQLTGDRREAVRALVEDGLARGASVLDLQAQVIQPAQEEIGRLWQLNLVTVAQEHVATAVARQALSALFERAPVPPRHGKKIAIACVEGELHELPARLVADYLELDGFEVIYLGENVPQGDLAAMVRDQAPDLVGLSVTMSDHMPALRDAVARLRVITDAPILAGGRALELSGSVAGLGVEVPGKRHGELIEAARRLAGIG